MELSIKHSQPLISICMPAYNAEKYISMAVHAVMQQTYTNWELIIVNDGSTDNTAAVLQTLADPRIKIVHQENLGQCAAANMAFGKATGELIKFLDADDVISADFLEQQATVLNGDDQSIATASWGRFYKDEIATFKQEPNAVEYDTEPIEWIVFNMTGRQAMLQCGLWLIPRNILLRSGLWDESLSLINDYEFLLRVLLQAKTIRFGPNAMLYYRSGLSGSLSRSRSMQKILSAFNSIMRGNQHLLAFENSSRIRRIAANNLRYWVYDVYPAFPELTREAEQQISLLGGSCVPFPAGGFTRFLSKALGWKSTKRLKSLLS